LATLVAVYFLILVGGIVRASGSGMGCPDWPTCFGRWIPPTRIDQLPADYKVKNAAYRERKNQKFARYLSMIGLQQTADKMVTDPSVLKEEDFNPTKTWVEYINRLVGVAIGLLIIAVVIAALPIRQGLPALFSGALALLALVIFQGWFGSIVVSTNLTSWTITVHMFLAIVMVCLLVWLWVKSGSGSPAAPASLKLWVLVGMIAMMIQTFLGTEIRESLDRAAAMAPRSLWISQAGIDFIIHRSFSWVVVLSQIAIYLKLRKTSSEKALYLVPILLVLCSVLTGSAMAYFNVPATMQPIHLLVAIVSIGWMFQVYLQSHNRTETAI
jgi:cytochrome c oxidase assembly protein subunit 15